MTRTREERQRNKAAYFIHFVVARHSYFHRGSPLFLNKGNGAAETQPNRQKTRKESGEKEGKEREGEQRKKREGEEERKEKKLARRDKDSYAKTWSLPKDCCFFFMDSRILC